MICEQKYIADMVRLKQQKEESDLRESIDRLQKEEKKRLETIN